MLIDGRQRITEQRITTMLISQRRAFALSWLLLTASAGGAFAGTSPMGTWVDHSGEGAVEITDCGGKLCGRVVWLKNPANQETCNLQVIGNAKPSSGGKWDGGWIYDPENKTQYDVEITPMGSEKLKVFGYAGVRLFGETMTWTRAPGDLKRCDVKEDVKVAPPAVPAVPQVTPSREQVAVVNPVPPVNLPVEGAVAETPAASPPAQPEAKGGVAVPVVPGQAAAKSEMKRPPVVASKKFKLEDLIDDIDVRKVKGKCDVTIKELGSFKFDC
jgi:uncharacterized protein (DUF2147 family)